MSNNSSSAEDRNHCCPVVTPGRLPVCATLRLTKWLSKVDLPTFGTPTHIARMARFCIPLAAWAANCSARTSLAAAVTFFATWRSRESKANTTWPRFAKKFCHWLTTFGSAKSVFVIINKRGLSPAKRCTSGFCDEYGTRASTNSKIISTRGICSLICRKAFAMCPGNH